MTGIFIFWGTYLISAIILYHILFCRYKVKCEWEGHHLKHTNSGERHKTPLWELITLLIAFFIPVINVAISGIVLAAHLVDGEVYIKSFLTREI